MDEARSLLYPGTRDVSLKGMFSWLVFYIFFTSRLKVNLYVLNEIGFPGELGKGKQKSWQGGRALTALPAEH